MAKFNSGNRVWVQRGAVSGSEIASTTEAFRESGGWAVVTEERPDKDGDIQVETDEVRVEIAGESPGRTFFYVREDDVSLERNESESQLDGVWVAWYNDDDSRVITVHAEEIHALRYAVNNGGQVKRLGYGEELVP